VLDGEIDEFLQAFLMHESVEEGSNQ